MQALVITEIGGRERSLRHLAPMLPAGSKIKRMFLTHLPRRT